MVVSTSTAALKIPQVFNAALAASVVVCAAQRSPEIIKIDDLFELKTASLIFVGFFVCVAWAMKNFVDEYRGFESGRIDGFSLARTVIFSTLAYLTLAATASNIGDQRGQQLFMMAYFAVLTLWSTASAIHRFSIPDGQGSENVERLSIRLLWLVIYPVCAALSYWIFISDSGFKLALGAIAIVIIYAVDVRNTKTFNTNHSGIV